MSEEKIMVYKVKCSECEDSFLMFTLPTQKPAENVKCHSCIREEKLLMIKTRTLVKSGTDDKRTIFAGISPQQFDTENRIIEVS